MTDFLNAINIGIISATNRESNFLEIHNVFSRLREEISNFSEYKIDTRLYSITENRFIRSLDYFEDNSQLYFNKKLNVALKNTTFNQVLTEIYFDRDNGYPCTLMIDGDEFTATNRESLEENIRKLLSSPSTGNILYSLMKKAP